VFATNEKGGQSSGNQAEIRIRLANPRGGLNIRTNCPALAAPILKMSKLEAIHSHTHRSYLNVIEAVVKIEKVSLIRLHVKLAVFFFAVETLHNFDKIVTVKLFERVSHPIVGAACSVGQSA